MEQRAEWLPAEEQREQRSFNPLASVDMARADIYAYGDVLPETRERIYDEELSLIVEGMDRAARTEFVLQREGDQLAYYKGGEWEPYMTMLFTGRTVAEAEAIVDPRKQFLLDDAIHDIVHGYTMQALKPGEQHVWSSPYRHDLEEKYGADFMRSCGRFPDRKMGFLYRAACDENGNVVLESQTVDNSDDEAFAAALDLAQSDSQATMDDLVRTYDQVLSGKQGMNFYAGRTDTERRENAWDQLRAQRDLIEYFISGIEMIARGPLRGDALEEAAKRHTYGVWAACKKRFDGGGGVLTSVSGTSPVVHEAMVAHEVHAAFRQFAAEGRVMAGCGGTIKILRGEKDILDASPDEVLNAIFGSEAEQEGAGVFDQYGPLSFQCTEGHWNTRRPGKLKESCGYRYCRGSVGCGETPKSASASREREYTKIMSEQWTRLVKTVLGKEVRKEFKLAA